MRSARPLSSEWPQMVKRMRIAPRRILLTDFDGTLAPIRRSPDDARLPKTTGDLLVRIRDCGGTVGVVSGRGLEDLIARVRLSGIWYAGSHGYRLRNPRGRLISLASAAERRRVSRAVAFLTPRLAPIRGVHLDVKRAAVAVHYRAATPSATQKAEAIVHDLLHIEPGLHLLLGKKVWELLPGNTVDKWTAVHRLLRDERVTNGTFVTYLGDDKTDESVFRGLRGGVSVVVGRCENTAARYCLPSTRDVRDFLRCWLSVERELAGKGKKTLKPLDLRRSRS